MPVERNPDNKWTEFLDLLMETIDVQDYLESKGVRFTGGVSSKGWAECHAVDRDDDKPSAAVNLANGYYKDLGYGPSYPFFQFLVHLGVYPTFYSAVEGLAVEQKMKSKMPKSRKGLSFWNKLKFKAKWSSVSCRGLLKELKISEKTLAMTGAKQVLTPSGEIAVALPVYSPHSLFEAEQAGIVLKNAGGGTLIHDRGKEAPPEHLKSKSLGTGGMLNLHAFSVWDEAEYVFKVEGVSDLLALQELIPESDRDRYVVTTNSDGCDAARTPQLFSHHLAGKKVIIIHDADEPGQYGEAIDKKGGAQRWLNYALANQCRWCVNLQLPYEIAEKKGKDLRDWISEGGTWEQLLEMVEGTEQLSSQDLAPEDNLTNLEPHQQILRALNLMVIGHRKSGAIEVFNANSMRRFEIPDIDRFSYNKMQIHIGKRAKEKIHPSHEGDPPPDKFTDVEVRSAIAEESGGKEISRANTIGIGIWEFAGRLVAVGAGEWLAINGGVQRYQTPMAADHIVDFGEREEAWYDSELLTGYLQQAKSPQWRKGHFEEIVAILKVWDNHKHPEAEELLASLMLCSWLQQIFPLRPWIGIQGESDSGKTALMTFITNYFGTLAEGNSNASEAGIRSAMRNTSKILLLDEFEASPERPKILNLLMGASRKGAMSGSLRANTRQESVRGGIEVIPWMAAVELKMDKQTERNRYLLFEMLDRSDKPYFTLPSDEQVHILRNKSIACVMSCWKRAMDLCSILIRNNPDRRSRVSEGYATAVAMKCALFGMEDHQAIAEYRRVLRIVDQAIEDSTESEQAMLMQAILDSLVSIGSGVQKTTGELLSDHTSGAESFLNRHGIKRMSIGDVMGHKEWDPDRHSESENPHVFFSTQRDSMIKRVLLKGTDHQKKNLATMLERFPGAFRCRVRCFGQNPRGVAIPASLIGSEDHMPWGPVEIDDDLSRI